jgi:hypothetical protein
MAKAKFTGTYNTKYYRVDVGLNMLIWEADGIFYCYSPALDLTGYGKTKEDAKQSFEDTMDEFITYAHNKRTIFDELEKLGWTVNKKKRRVSAPSEQQMLEDNETYKELSNQAGVIVEHQKLL